MYEVLHYAAGDEWSAPRLPTTPTYIDASCIIGTLTVRNLTPDERAEQYDQWKRARTMPKPKVVMAQPNVPDARVYSHALQCIDGVMYDVDLTTGVYTPTDRRVK